MAAAPRISAPPYHVQSTVRNARNGFPYFAHHGSVSKLWSEEWRKPCAAGIYPFTDADVGDFDPIFAELERTCGDRPAQPQAAAPAGEVIVFNNGSLGFIELEQKSSGFLDTGTTLENPDFARLAEAVGIKGMRIEDPAEVEDKLADAFARATDVRSGSNLADLGSAET